MTNATEESEPMVTLRMPMSTWRGIVNGIEKWVGDGASSDIEILSDIELVDGHPSAIWWLNGYYDDVDPFADATKRDDDPDSGIPG
jgi:hypothetical protein